MLELSRQCGSTYHANCRTADCPCFCHLPSKIKTRFSAEERDAIDSLMTGYGDISLAIQALIRELKPRP